MSTAKRNQCMFSVHVITFRFRANFSVPPPRRISRPNKWLLIIVLVTTSLVYINRPLARRHLVVISSTYYNKSNSLQNNTVVILFNSNRKWYIERPLLCLSQNQTHEHTALAHVQFAFDPISICSWTTFIAHCPTVENPKVFELTSTGLTSNPADVSAS
ncbi:hypothetical protein L596_004406 [Steinernema carpocapsae]|uniref:Uncharacterized protein n=1 Tax=Steinernema carpocapsae TaxID=34508 RepID=A0A4U8UWR4_STECR|nr:hypothetical protein L596_004406 [Steinernema carpocapsae]